MTRWLTGVVGPDSNNVSTTFNATWDEDLIKSAKTGSILFAWLYKLRDALHPVFRTKDENQTG